MSQDVRRRGSADRGPAVPKVTREPPATPTPRALPATLGCCPRPRLSLLTGQRLGPHGIMEKQSHLYVGSDPTRFATFCAMAEPVGQLWAFSTSLLLLARRAQNQSSGFGQNCVLLPVLVHTLLPSPCSAGGLRRSPCEYLGRTPQLQPQEARGALGPRWGCSLEAPSPCSLGRRGQEAVCPGWQEGAVTCSGAPAQGAVWGRGPVGFLGKGQGAKARLGMRVWGTRNELRARHPIRDLPHSWVLPGQRVQPGSEVVHAPVPSSGLALCNTAASARCLRGGSDRGLLGDRSCSASSAGLRGVAGSPSLEVPLQGPLCPEPQSDLSPPEPTCPAPPCMCTHVHVCTCVYTRPEPGSAVLGAGAEGGTGAGHACSGCALTLARMLSGSWSRVRVSVRFTCARVTDLAKLEISPAGAHLWTCPAARH